MNGLMIKSLAFSALLIIATIYVVMSLDIDIFQDSVNAITMAGAIAIAVITSAVSVKYLNQMKNDTATGELVDDTWDGIGEYTNELPSGWAYSFLGTFLWSMWYGFFGYPINAYSQIGEYNEEVLAYNKEFESKHQNANVATLKQMGKSLFFVQCAPCHGNEGDGLSGKAQDFASRMTKAQVLDVINHGSDNQLGYGIMPAGMASGQDAEDIAKYVANGLKGEAPTAYATCISCHGADSKGQWSEYMKAPTLVGYSNRLMTQVLQNGKKGILGTMPAFKSMITPIQEKALSAYIQTLKD
jgi:cytochrome c oxidase cbb3-type subunit 3